MFTRHISRRLAAYLDGELAPRRMRQMELHMARCARCRNERDQIRAGIEMMDQLPEMEAPAAIWPAIEAALPQRRPYRTKGFHRWRWALAASAALVLISAAYWRLAEVARTRWEVVRLDGSPVVGAKRIGDGGRIGAGEWIETDAGSRALVKVGVIGSVEVEQNTRLRVVTAQPGEHRLKLARGEIRAKISAPPRLFFVETASGTAVDLGCEYTLRTDADGTGILQVTKGWVSFQREGIESLVPAGASCRTRPHGGAGIPYFEDAPESLKEAIDRFGLEKTADDGLGVILAGARVRDTLSLWHLLSRVEVADRGRVYDRMAALAPVPAGVSRELVLKLDPGTLTRWKEELAWKW